MVYAPGTLETDPKKQNMALQQQAKAITTATSNIATNTADIAALETAAGTRTRQVFLSGSGTYTTPANVRYIIVRATGGGGGGAGSGTTPGAATDGGDTTFGSLTASKGTKAVTNSHGSGGSPSDGDVNIIGGSGQSSGTTNTTGGGGGISIYGGAGWGGNISPGNGFSAQANSGSGGGGAGAAGTGNGGGGGGAGGSIEKIITSPSATYSYSVGAGGTGGTLGTSGAAGGNGGSGRIIVDEFY